MGQAEAYTGRTIRALVYGRVLMEPLSSSIQQFSVGEARIAITMTYTEMIKVYSSVKAFAAVRPNGSVVTWGNPHCGADSSSVQTQLTDIRSIASTRSSLSTFAAIIAGERGGAFPQEAEFQPPTTQGPSETHLNGNRTSANSVHLPPSILVSRHSE